VEVKGHVTRRSVVQQIEVPVLPERGKPVTPHGATAWLRMVLREGKKRQIRHMTAAVGLPTLRILRIAIGSISLNALQPGEWRFLTPAEIEALKKILQADAPRRVPKKILDASSSTAAENPGASAGNNRGSRYRSGARPRRDR
jgi:23S rRNA pseudouridine2457 synthase